MDANTIKKLKRLPDMGELVIDGAIWTKFSDSHEFKVSPHGAAGDFDKDARWVDYSELEPS